MPLPFILGVAATVAGAVGVGSGIHGGKKMNDANDTMKSAKLKQEWAVNLLETRNTSTTDLMDKLGKKELEILKSFEQFSDTIEKIQGRPEFKTYSQNGVKIPQYEPEELKKISMGAGVLLGGIGGAAAGTAGGFAAAGATTSAVMALGTASTGTAISTLSGVAATNATLAALGGGSLATGGGGMALGSAVLGGATLGVGLLVGGIIFNITGSKLSEKADEAWAQANETVDNVNEIVEYFNDLCLAANVFSDALIKVETQYKKRIDTLDYIVNFSEKTQWSEFTDKEKMMTENLVLLVGLLYKMCKVNLVIKSEQKDGLNTVNHFEINKTTSEAEDILDKLNDVA